MTDEQPASRRDALRAPEATPDNSGAAGAPAKPRKRRTVWIITALAATFVLLGSGAVYAGVASASVPVPTVESPSATPKPPRPVPVELAAASKLRTCSVDKFAKDARLMKFAGSVVLVKTGDVLFARRGSSSSRTGSVMKVSTAAAALSVLGPDYRITTSVVDGSTAGSIVLIGRGDPTLSAGGASVYGGAPKLSDLAAKAIATYTAKHPGVPITQLVLDAGYWDPADKWDSSWKRTEQTIGYHSEVTALMVDGDRANPAAQTSPRSTNPIKRAGTAFLAALRNADPGGVIAGDVSVTSGAALSGSAVLGEVKSQPVKKLIGQMLPYSDNTLAEMLARIVSKESGFDGSAASLQQAIPSALSAYDVDPTGLKIRDGSGLSDLNGFPANTMATLMVKVWKGNKNLGIIRDALPVAGVSGTLASRFTGDAAVARGHVRAKTGWIDTAYTLAGMIEAKDGTKVTFAFYAVGAGISDNAKQALDALAAAVYRCGDNLSNN